jgi:hypothetical protein
MSEMAKNAEEAVMIEYVQKEAMKIANKSRSTARCHFITSDRWARVHLWLGVPATIMAAIAGASALSQFAASNLIAAFLGITVATLTALATFLDPGGRASAHQNAGNKILSISNDARMFSEIECLQAENIEEITQQLKILANRLNELNENSPLIPEWAFKKNRERLNKRRKEKEFRKFMNLLRDLRRNNRISAEQLRDYRKRWEENPQDRGILADELVALL